MSHLVYIVRYSVVPINCSPLTIILHRSVINKLVYNEIKWSLSRLYNRVRVYFWKFKQANFKRHTHAGRYHYRWYWIDIRKLRAFLGSQTMFTKDKYERFLSIGHTISIQLAFPKSPHSFSYLCHVSTHFLSLHCVLHFSPSNPPWCTDINPYPANVEKMVN
jgi:hypothetical protein